SRLSLIASWAVITGHLTVAGLYLYGGPFVFVAISISFAFHVSVAVFMRLNVFVYAFLATYPAMITFSDAATREAFIRILFP
ncbi:hypothetical protein, partial [Moorena sp. SIO3F7]